MLNFRNVVLRLLACMLFSGSCLATALPPDSIGVKNENGKTFILHKVSAGESWYAISRKYGISYAELRMANKDISDRLNVGQVIQVPAKAKLNDPRFQKNYMDKQDEKEHKAAPHPAEAVSGNPVLHRVSASETLYSISRKYKVTVQEIRDWNKLSSNTIEVNQELIVGYHSGEKPVPQKQEPLPSGEVKTFKSDSVREKPATVVSVPEKKDAAVDSQVWVMPVPAEKEDVQEKDDRKFTFANGRREVNESGTIGLIENEDVNPDKYYALHRTCPAGTIVRITNLENGKSLFVKVVGQLQDAPGNEEVIFRISKAAAGQLGVSAGKFRGHLLYGLSH